MPPVTPAQAGNTVYRVFDSIMTRHFGTRSRLSVVAPTGGTVAGPLPFRGRARSRRSSFTLAFAGTLWGCLRVQTRMARANGRTQRWAVRSAPLVEATVGEWLLRATSCARANANGHAGR
jgi:hypothetical protein